MSVLTEILDRLSGVAQLKERLAQQDKIIERMQIIVLEQQKDIAEIKGAIKAVVSMHSERLRIK